MSASQNDTKNPRFRRGRPSKYSEEKKAEALSLRDNTTMTLTAIAEAVKVPPSTVTYWFSTA